MIKNSEPIVADNYYVEVTESLFTSFKIPENNGVCINIDYTGCLVFISHSTMSNEDAALYVLNADTIRQEYICYDNNKGYRGSHHCRYVKASMANYTNEKSHHQFHGPMVSGLHVCNFNFNNASKCTVNDEAQWHYYKEHALSITKYCQMYEITSDSISSCDASQSRFNLHNFNYVNCSAKTINSIKYPGTLLTFNNCFFVVNPGISMGSQCTFVHCFSDGSVDILEKTSCLIEITFPEYILCLYSQLHILRDVTARVKSRQFLVYFMLYNICILTSKTII